MSSGNLWVKDENLFWLWVSFVVESGSNGGGSFLVGSGLWLSLEESSRDWGWWVKSRWVLWGDVSRSLVWLSGGWLGVVVWDSGWLLSSAWGTGWAIEWTVGSIADSSSAVSSVKTVGTSADWEWSGGFNNDWNP